MPRILIKETDRTSAGTAGQYSNYAVLVAGFMGNGSLKNESVAPDSNGVYEFMSLKDFNEVIGVVDPSYTYVDGDHELTVQHYGNLMARELLSMGYPVIYLPINPDDGVGILAKASTWEIFKDKASYDFRFVTHGLLKSYTTGEAKDLETRIEELEEAPGKLFEALTSDGAAKAKLDELEIKKADDLLTATMSDLTSDALEEVYENIDAENIPGIKDPSTAAKYETLALAIFGDTDTIGIINELAAKKALFEKRVINSTTLYNKLDAAGHPVPVEGTLIFDEEGKPTYNGFDQVLVKTNTLDKDGKPINKYVDPVKLTENTGIISQANANIANLAKYVADEANTGRGDCIALIELDENAYANTTLVKPELAIVNAINQQCQINAANGKYCAMTVPSVVYTGVDTGKIKKLPLPGAFHYLACFMNSLRSGFAEWYAAAGYTRGVSSYRIDHTTVTLGEIAINALEPRNTDGSDTSPKFACNVIANFRGSYYLWGNRTAEPLRDINSTEGNLKASHFLNIRQLCTTVKKQLFVACRRFTFDPNSDTLWFNFVNAIKPTLEAMKADQGIRDYKIIKEHTDVKATLKAKIRIIPIEAVEDFDIEVSLEDAFGETAVSTGDMV